MSIEENTTDISRKRNRYIHIYIHGNACAYIAP